MNKLVVRLAIDWPNRSTKLEEANFDWLNIKFNFLIILVVHLNLFKVKAENAIIIFIFHISILPLSSFYWYNTQIYYSA